MDETSEYMIVGIAGMSHLGVVGAIALAFKGSYVRAFDSNSALTKKMRTGNFDIYEPNLIELYEKSKKLIQWTDNIEDLADCDLVIVALDIESSESGFRNDSKVNSLIEQCLKIVKPGITLIVNSQVTPGTTRKYSALARVRNIDLFYQVETLVFGEAMQRALHPERIIIGAEKALEYKDLPIIYQSYLRNFNVPTVLMDFESAELSKICINLFLIFSITFSDILSIVSSQVGASWHNIVNAMRLDARIGEKSYLRPSLGLNGINLIRDLRVIQHELLDQHPYHSFIANVEEISTVRRKHLMYRIETLIDTFSLSRIFFFGMAYKEGTSSLANSPAFLAYKNFSTGFEVDFYDSFVTKLPDGKKCKSLNSIDLLEGIILVVTHKIPEEQEQQLIKATLGLNKVYIVDPFELLNLQIRKSCQYYESFFETRGEIV